MFFKTNEVKKFKTIELEIKNNLKLILTKEQFKRLPKNIPTNIWRLIKIKNYNYIICKFQKETYFLQHYLFTYNQNKERIVYPDGPLNFSTAFITNKQRVVANTDFNNKKLPKNGIFFNGCCIIGSHREGSRCKYSWRCKNYVSCLDQICTTTEIGWNADGRGFIYNEDLQDVIKN